MVLVPFGLALALSACSSSFADPVFDSVSLSDISVKGGDCAWNRCVMVTATVRGSREGEGSCALYGPGDPETLEPLAEHDSIEMIPDEESEWVAELPDGSPDTPDLNAVCEPMAEG